MPYASYSSIDSGSGIKIVTVKLKTNPVIEAALLVVGVLLLVAMLPSFAFAVWQRSVQHIVMTILAVLFACLIVKLSAWNLFAFDKMELGNGCARLSQKFGPFLLGNIEFQKVKVFSRMVFGGRHPREEFALRFSNAKEIRVLNFGFEQRNDVEQLARIIHDAMEFGGRAAT